MDITWVKKDDVRKIWPQVEPYVLKALKRWVPAYRPADILEGIEKELMQLWIFTDAKEEKLYGTCITKIEHYPLMKQLNIYMLSGNKMHRWKKDFVEMMRKFGKSEGCSYVQATGRRGWVSFPGAFETGTIVNAILE